MKGRLRQRVRGGSALIMVLWVIAMMSLLVVSFAFDAHLEGRIVSYARKRRKAEALAFSGMRVARGGRGQSASISNRSRCGATATA